MWPIIDRRPTSKRCYEANERSPQSLLTLSFVRCNWLRSSRYAENNQHGDSFCEYSPLCIGNEQKDLVRCDTVSGSGAAKRSPSEQRCTDATMIDASELLNMTGVPLHLALECTPQRETGAIP
jgi:hypothetical protein